MSELTLTVIRLGFLVLIWVLVLTVVSVMRADLRSPRATPRVAARTSQARPQQPQGRKKKGTPKTLVVTEGSLAGTKVSLGSAGVTIGRAQDSTLVLDDDYASTRHARIAQNPDGTWFVEDLGSTNGTYVGRNRIDGPTPVAVGTSVRIGKTVVELRK